MERPNELSEIVLLKQCLEELLLGFFDFGTLKNNDVLEFLKKLDYEQIAYIFLSVKRPGEKHEFEKVVAE